MYHYQFPMILSRAQRVLERMQRELFLESKDLKLSYAPCNEHLSFAEKDKLNYQAIEEGEEWGRSADLVWASAWFSVQVDLASEIAQWEEKLQSQGAEIALYLDLCGEALIFDAKGKIVQGLSSGSVFDPHFSRVLVHKADELLDNGKLQLWVEAAANTLFGLSRDDDPHNVAKTQSNPPHFGEHIGLVNSAKIVLLDKNLWHYLLDLENALGLAQNLLQSKAAGSWGTENSEEGKTASPRAKRLIFSIDQSLSCHAYRRENLEKAHAILREKLYNGHGPSDLQTLAVGHAHIDSAWLWPVKEVLRKCARTFANQLRLMEHYPNYIFGSSQAQHYQFIKDRYPQIYTQIQQRVKEGRWEIQGAMWVEADANIPSGESLVRQVLHGKNFFMDEFGIEVKNLWLPDVFGYSANLPQILKRSGVDYFLTQKLSWSQYNDFPYHSFHWYGIDNSSVLTHFPPEATYNSSLSLRAVHGVGLCGAQNRFKEAHVLDEFLTLYGMGDGGGGPDEAMIERGLRLGANGDSTAEGSPHVSFGRADEFFAHLDEKSSILPAWRGELYLELHRGTLTSQARTKQGNRQLEQALRTLEYLYSLSSSWHSGEYPQAEFDRLWKLLLLNQFHDIIPGSSIHEVYQNTQREHGKSLAECHDLLRTWLQEQLQEADGLVLINPYSLPIRAVLRLPATWQGLSLAGSGCKILGTANSLALVDLAPQAMLNVASGPALQGSIAVTAQQSCEHFVLENEWIRYTLNRKGQLIEVYDKEFDLEFLAANGLGNNLKLYRDWPRDWDAWEIDLNYEEELLENLEAEKIELLAGTYLRQTLRLRFSCGKASQLEQKLSLEAGSKRLLFQNKVDWHERHCMLRVRFETGIHAQKASYDIQYGYLERPTHSNTSWEMAQFEVVGQYYADVSEYDFGVSLLNDCKYGYHSQHTKEGCFLDLNLLRSPSLPDPEADQSSLLGQHEFCYALLPHVGNLQTAMPALQAEAARLNHYSTTELSASQDILCFPGKLPEDRTCPIRVHSENVILEVLKKAEKSEDFVLRLVERAGRHSVVRLSFCGSLQECDLLEWQAIGEPIYSNDELLFTPFAIRTFLLKS